MTDLHELYERTKRCHGRDPRLNRDIEVALGKGRNCDNPTRQHDNYAMPLHRDDYYVPPEYTRIFDVALTLMPFPMVVNLVPVTEPLEWGPHIKWTANLVRLEDGDMPQGWIGYGANAAIALTGALLLSIRQLRKNCPSKAGAAA